MLWMHKHMSGKYIKPEDTSTMDTGTAVGEKAREYFGEYSLVTGEYNADKLKETGKFLDDGKNVICEASFEYDGTFCSVDIFRKVDSLNKDEDCYEIIEVKSSTDSSYNDKGKKFVKKSVKSIDMYDMAYQYYVVTNSGLTVSRVAIMRLNAQYTKNSDTELFSIDDKTVLDTGLRPFYAEEIAKDKKFTKQEVDITELVIRMQPSISSDISKMKALISNDIDPGDCIGTHCDSPYTCGYKTWCWRNDIIPSGLTVFDIGWGMWAIQKDEIYQDGHVSFEQIYNNRKDLKPMQQLQVETVVKNLEPKIMKKEINEFFEKLKGQKIYHLDFETLTQAIPEWDDVRPFMQIPFQFSLHIQDSLGDEDPEHKEFLPEEKDYGKDPRRALATRLYEDIPEGACVIAYSAASAERPWLRLLADFMSDKPDIAKRLRDMANNIIDPKFIFNEGLYYTRKIGGSASIKSVLPALFPGDTELDYTSLTISGSTAGPEYVRMYKERDTMTTEEKDRIRKDLLKYCHLDTLAIVRLFNKLYNEVK
jgi:hypothetical protein